ncbi:unnamed protein product, partial [Candidula unifasciata]
MKGPGTKEDVIIEVVTRNSNSQRQTVKKRFTEIYNQDLVERIKSELTGDFKDTILALLMPPVELDVDTLYKSMKGLGADEPTLIGVICSKTGADLDEVKQEYKKEYKSDLESDVRKETKGDLRDLLVQLLAGNKDKDPKVDQVKAEKDATTLYGQPKPSVVKEIFLKNSLPQIKAISDAHKKIFHKDISVSIKRASCGDAEEAYLACALRQQNKTKYFADRLRSSLKRAGVNNRQLIWALVSRSEKDLPAIKGKYRQLYGSPLREDVKTETTGDYEKTLLTIIDKVGEEKPTDEEDPSLTTDDEINEYDEDAVKLHKAMAGAGAKEDVITEVITRNSNPERQKVKKRYQEIYNKDLVKDLDAELSGIYQDLMLALLMPPLEYDAFCLNKAMKGTGTDETTLISLICSKSAADLDDIKNEYKK